MPVRLVSVDRRVLAEWGKLYTISAQSRRPEEGRTNQDAVLQRDTSKVQWCKQLRGIWGGRKRCTGRRVLFWGEVEGLIDLGFRAGKCQRIGLATYAF